MKTVVPNNEYRNAIKQITEFDKLKSSLSSTNLNTASEKIQRFFGLSNKDVFDDIYGTALNYPFEDSSAKKEYESVHIQELNYNLIMNITELCDHNDISFRALEEAVGLSNGSIRKWETVSPSIDKVSQVAEYFNVEISTLTSSYADKKETAIILEDILNSGTPIYIKTYADKIKELNSKEKKLLSDISKSINIPSKNEYRVRTGDNLHRIAVAHGVFVEDIKRLNGLSSNNIEAGQLIKIPIKKES